jgi:hypothetical protein
MWAVRTKARESCSSTSDGDVVARQVREGGRESPEGGRERGRDGQFQSCCSDSGLGDL